MEKLIKMLMIIIIGSFIISTASGQSLTEDYKVGIGLRGGETSGITVKFNTTNTASIELIGGLWSNWVSVTGLFEKRVQAFNVTGMKWYFGGGGHVAFETGTYFEEGRMYYSGDDFALGIDGIVGLEYKIPPIPFAISLDVKPFVEIYRTGNIFFAIDPGIGVKFTF